MDYLLGSIIWLTFQWAPVGTMLAEGQCLSIAQNAALYSLVGNRYGGDGRQTFCVPDLRPKNQNGQSDWGNGPRAVIVTSGIYPSRP
jgi:microcystin-dependent protein